MPEITVKMFEGRTAAQKEEITQVFTRELSRILDGQHGQIVVDFVDVPRDSEQ